MILVTGATSEIGRLLVDLLVAQETEVRAVTRNPQMADLPANIEVVQGDQSRLDTLAKSICGVTGIFLHPFAIGDAVHELIALAKTQGVQRLVVMQAMNVNDNLQPSQHKDDKNREVEDAVIGSGLDWVSLRTGFFATNTISMWATQIHAGDIVRGPYATFAWSPIDPLDVAEIATRALVTDELGCQRIVLTGPQSLTHAEMVAIIGYTIGRPLEYEQISPEEARQVMIQLGLRERFVNAYLEMMARAIGQPAVITDEVEKILGRPAHTFVQWTADHAYAFQIVGS